MEDGRGKRADKPSKAPLRYIEGCGLRSHWAPLQQKHQRPARLRTMTCHVFTVRSDLYLQQLGSQPSPETTVKSVFLFACEGCTEHVRWRWSQNTNSSFFFHIHKPVRVCDLNCSQRSSLSLLFLISSSFFSSSSAAALLRKTHWHGCVLTDNRCLVGHKVLASVQGLCVSWRCWTDVRPLCRRRCFFQKRIYVWG